MEQKDDFPDIDYHALAEFRYQIRRFLRFSEQTAHSAGLETQQYQLLLALKGLATGHKATVGELAERLQIQHHSAVELINRLVERDLVQRRRGEIDQRQVIVSLTSSGEEVLRKLALYHRTELQSIGPALVQALETLITDTGAYSSHNQQGEQKGQELIHNDEERRRFSK